jgi:hypothetical protein
MSELLVELEKAGGGEGGIGNRGLAPVAVQIAFREGVPGKRSQEVQEPHRRGRLGHPLGQSLLVRPESV